MSHCRCHDDRQAMLKFTNSRRRDVQTEHVQKQAEQIDDHYSQDITVIIMSDMLDNSAQLSTIVFEIDVVGNPYFLSQLHDGEGKIIGQQHGRILFMYLSDRNGGLQQSPVEHNSVCCHQHQNISKVSGYLCHGHRPRGNSAAFHLPSLHYHCRKSGSQCVLLKSLSTVFE